MNVTNLRINELSAEGWGWYQGYLSALDAYDLPAYTAFLSPDVAVQFNNDEPMVSRDVAGQGLGAFWKSVTQMGYSLVHEPQNIYGTDEHFVMEALNHYDHVDGSRITVRATAWTDRDGDGYVTSVRLYQDLSTLYSKAGSRAPE